MEPLSKEKQLHNLKVWVQALRSGKYRQTQGRLKDDKGYCGLGVAHDLIPGCEWIQGESAFIPFDCRVFGKTIIGRQIESEALEKFFGLSQEEMLNLVHNNDHGKDFRWIADYIENEIIAKR